MKLEKDGSAIFTEVHEFAAAIRSGEVSWDKMSLDDIDIRLKWAGLFHRRKRTPGAFMMRLRVPNGLLTSDQMRYCANAIAVYGENGCIDVTTRQNLQLRGMPLEAAADITKGLYNVGLSSVMSGALCTNPAYSHSFMYARV
jgi:ferredoxin-nitrite reductase